MQSFVHVGDGLPGAVQEEVVPIFEFLQHLLLAGVSPDFRGGADQLPDNGGESIGVAGVDHQSGHALQPFLPVAGLRHVRMERKPYAMPGSEFVCFLGRCHGRVDLPVEHQERRVIVEGLVESSLQIRTRLDVQCANSNS